MSNTLNWLFKNIQNGFLSFFMNSNEKQWRKHCWGYLVSFSGIIHSSIYYTINLYIYYQGLLIPFQFSSFHCVLYNLIPRTLTLKFHFKTKEMCPTVSCVSFNTSTDFHTCRLFLRSCRSFHLVYKYKSKHLSE